MKRGQRKTIAAPGSPKYVHVFGAYNWRDAHVFHQSYLNKNSESFIDFVDDLMRQIPPNKKAVMVLDNASYHRSHASMAALSLFEERLRVLWLPTYCPFLNLIERFWLHLKTLAAANHLHLIIDDLIDAIDTVIQQQNLPDFPDQLDFAKHFRLPA